MEFQLRQRYHRKHLEDFSKKLLAISEEIGMRISSRGWCYILEGYRLINKNQFDKVDALINSCRREGFLPIDFIAEIDRQFSGVEEPDEKNVVYKYGQWLRSTMNIANHYVPDWWEGESYYIQIIVEKVDLVAMFQPVCEEYHIPIANAKGWSNMLQRAEYARRYAEAEDKNLQCVLLYCGDHDPDGLRISTFIENNLKDLENIIWEDGTAGYNPDNLIIDRFGLNYEFIIANNLTWIDNLITGNKTKHMDLSSPSHKNHHMPYVQQYLKKIGKRKCEANAIVTRPQQAQQLVREAIERYLGPDALDRFAVKRQAVIEEFYHFLDQNKIRKSMDIIFKKIDKYG